MKARITATLLAISSLVLAACASPETSAGAGRDVVLDLTDLTDAEVTAAPGDTITLRIAENRTTAYTWQPGPLPDGVVALDDAYVPDPQPESEDGAIMTGVGGTRVFTYRCDRAASGTFAYKLTAPWDPANPLREKRAALTCR